jgi:hypothetical protein
MQVPSKIFRRLARSAKNPEGKLAMPAKSVRAEASAPACAKLNPKELVMIGNTTTTTPLKRCSVMCALQFAASRPQPANGFISVCTFSAFDKILPRVKLSTMNMLNFYRAQLRPKNSGEPFE